MTSTQRTYLAFVSLGLVLIGVTARFGWEWAAIVAGVIGVLLALILAVGAVR